MPLLTPFPPSSSTLLFLPFVSSHLSVVPLLSYLPLFFSSLLSLWFSFFLPFPHFLLSLPFLLIFPTPPCPRHLFNFLIFFMSFLLWFCFSSFSFLSLLLLFYFSFSLPPFHLYVIPPPPLYLLRFLLSFSFSSSSHLLFLFFVSSHLH